MAFADRKVDPFFVAFFGFSGCHDSLGYVGPVRCHNGLFGPGPFHPGIESGFRWVQPMAAPAAGIAAPAPSAEWAELPVAHGSVPSEVPVWLSVARP